MMAILIAKNIRTIGKIFFALFILFFILGPVYDRWLEILESQNLKIASFLVYASMNVFLIVYLYFCFKSLDLTLFKANFRQKEEMKKDISRNKEKYNAIIDLNAKPTIKMNPEVTEKINESKSEDKYWDILDIEKKPNLKTKKDDILSKK
mgnify:FL=1